MRFTAHNIRLDDGSCTIPGAEPSMDANPTFLAARRVLDLVFPGDKSAVRIADLGCLEGGYAVEFARMGFQALGLDVRDSNLEACRWVKAKTNLPNLEFVKDDAWNVARYGPFDAVFCCGLYYHIEDPRRFLEVLAKVARRVLILQTHFAERRHRPGLLPRGLRRRLARLLPLPETGTTTFQLSRLTTHEGQPGRWYQEFATEPSLRERESRKWASWANRRSFWVQREYLLQGIRDVGFDAVFEQFDGLAPDIAQAMTRGSYVANDRGTFVGIRSAGALPGRAHGAG